MGSCGSVAVSEEFSPSVVELVAKAGHSDAVIGIYDVAGKKDGRPYFQKRDCEGDESTEYHSWLYYRRGRWLISDKLWGRKFRAYVPSDAKIPISVNLQQPWLVTSNDHDWHIALDLKVKEYLPSLLKVTGRINSELINGIYGILGEVWDRPFYQRRPALPDGNTFLYYNNERQSWMIGDDIWTPNCVAFSEGLSRSPATNTADPWNIRIKAGEWHEDTNFQVVEIEECDIEQDDETDEDETYTYSYSQQGGVGNLVTQVRRPDDDDDPKYSLDHQEEGLIDLFLHLNISLEYVHAFEQNNVGANDLFYLDENQMRYFIPDDDARNTLINYLRSIDDEQETTQEYYHEESIEAGAQHHHRDHSTDIENSELEYKDPNQDDDESSVKKHHQMLTDVVGQAQQQNQEEMAHES